MKVIIDIPEEQYNTIKSDLYDTFPAEMRKWGLEAIRHGTPMPDNATNGDVIDLIFPYEKIIDEVWWNASYQKGGKE